MRLSKRQLKRIIREEYSRLKRRGLIKEGSWSNDPIEDAYMCASETCEIEEGSTQLIHDMYYIAEQFDLEDLLSNYVDQNAKCSEEVALMFQEFLMDAGPEAAACAKAFSQFWETHYIG